MGVNGSKEGKNLVIKNRLLERQLSQNLQVDQITKSRIHDIKQNHTYTNLVLAGSAVKSFSLVGALGYLHDRHYLSNICNIACSSFGAFFAVLYAVGYSPPELKRIAEGLNMEDLIYQDIPLTSDIFHSATAEYGRNNGQYLMELITDLIEQKTGKRQYNFEDLLKEKGISLIVTIMDITSGSPIYLWYKDYPKLPLRAAVRMSCATPSVYTPVIFDGHYLVDSIVAGDTPCSLYIFDRNKPTSTKEHGECKEDPGTLHLLPIGDLPLDNDLGVKHQEDISSCMSFLASILNTTSRNTGEGSSFWLRTVPIHVPGYPMCYYNVTHAQKIELMSLGYSETKKFFNNI